jgi:hypothetical protein
MDLSLTHFIGIDLSGGRNCITCAILDGSRRILFRGVITLSDLEKQMADSGVAIAAITFPISINEGLMAGPEKRKQLNPLPPRNRFTNLRVCEYELIARGFSPTRTPSTLEDCSPSLQRMLRFSSELAANGFQRWPSPGSERQLMETHADAAFSVLIGLKALPANSLEGRIQRQLALQEERINVPDAMEFFEEITRHKLLSGKLPEGKILPTAELNALIAAFTAWSAYTNPSAITRLGDAAEGRIILPVTTRSN